MSNDKRIVPIDGVTWYLDEPVANEIERLRELSSGLQQAFDGELDHIDALREENRALRERLEREEFVWEQAVNADPTLDGLRDKVLRALDGEGR